MTRDIPNLRMSLLYPLTGGRAKEAPTPEKYISEIEKFERKVEKSLIETFNRINIKGTVKTDPYSLPFKNEIEVTLRGESYLNGAYEVYRVARKIVKQLLEEDVYQLRFYMFINVEESFPMGKIVYRFRYYPK